MSIAFAVFVSLFALDVFGAGYGFWGTLVALAMHLIPTAIIVVALVLAWRWEWIGTVLYAAAGCFLMYWNLARGNPVGAIALAVPLFLIAALFALNWIKRKELRGWLTGRS